MEINIVTNDGFITEGLCKEDEDKLFRYLAGVNNAESELDQFKMLLQKYNCSVNYKSKLRNGLTLLMDATSRRKLLIVKYIIEQGADLNIQDNAHRTALHWSMLVAPTEGFFLRSKYAFKCVYVIGSALPVIQILVDNGIDLSIKNIKGRTALDYARKFAYNEIVSLLLNADAKKLQKLEEEKILKLVEEKRLEEERKGVEETKRLVEERKRLEEIVNCRLEKECKKLEAERKLLIEEHKNLLEIEREKFEKETNKLKEEIKKLKNKKENTTNN